MNRKTPKNMLATAGIFILLAIPTVIRYFTIIDVLPPEFGMLRNAIHISLLVGWGISLHLRIIQTQVRRYLLSVVALMELWLVLKIVNYTIESVNLNRTLWYLYYVPMLFIPLVALFVSMLLGKAEDTRLPQGMKLLYVPTAVLLLLVLTNDVHQLVFSFPSGVMTRRDYRHEIGYYVVLWWIMLCALVSFVVMLKKCRIPRSRKILILPLVPLALSFVYTIAYIRNNSIVLLLAGDMTVVQCLLICAMFESCIQCGLIQSNMGYKELFEATTLPVQITDTDFSTQNISAAMQEVLPQNKLQRMMTDTVFMDNDTLLKRHPLREGWVFWKEDIAELNRLGEELKLTYDELRDTGDVLAEENEQNEKLLRLSEENRLYDMMETQTARQVTMLRELLTKLQHAWDTDEAKKILGQIILIGTYIKRRNNLIFVGAKSGTVSVQELSLCLNESMENLNLYGVECKAHVNGDGLLGMQHATQIYDLFEAVVEAEFSSLKSLLISVEIGKQTEVNLCVAGKETLFNLKAQFPWIEWTQDEDGLQYVSFCRETELFGNRGVEAYG